MAEKISQVERTLSFEEYEKRRNIQNKENIEAFIDILPEKSKGNWIRVSQNDYSAEFFDIELTNSTKSFQLRKMILDDVVNLLKRIIKLTITKNNTIDPINYQYNDLSSDQINGIFKIYKAPHYSYSKIFIKYRYTKLNILKINLKYAASVSIVFRDIKKLVITTNNIDTLKYECEDAHGSNNELILNARERIYNIEDGNYRKTNLIVKINAREVNKIFTNNQNPIEINENTHVDNIVLNYNNTFVDDKIELRKLNYVKNIHNVKVIEIHFFDYHNFTKSMTDYALDSVNLMCAIECLYYIKDNYDIKPYYEYEFTSEEYETLYTIYTDIYEKKTTNETDIVISKVLIKYYKELKSSIFKELYDTLSPEKQKEIRKYQMLNKYKNVI